MMSLSSWKRTTVAGIAIIVALCADCAYAIDPGCYPADVVRAGTWNAKGAEKQYTLIQGERAVPTKNKNYFTSSLDGKVGYNIENSGNGPDDGRLCVGVKLTDVRLNTGRTRPTWLRLPPGSENDVYLSGHERKYRTRVLITAATVVRRRDGSEIYGPQLVVTKSEVPLGGVTTGAAFTNNPDGNGSMLFAMGNVVQNPAFDQFAKAINPIGLAP